VIKIGDELPDKFNKMPIGLFGYWWETEHQICIPVVENAVEGDGTFSKWLTSLESKGKMIFFPTVISARLDAILRKRGYKEAYVMDKDMGGIDGLAKEPK